MDAKQRIEETALELGLTMTAEFIPWSKSRNAKEKEPSLNWRVTLHKDGREVLTADYMAGMGHCPSYTQSLSRFKSIDQREAIRQECETGKANRFAATLPRDSRSISTRAHTTGESILPELADVLYSFALDSDAIDYAAFEEWASNYGYDTDSRSAESAYRACLEIALKLRSAIGDEGLTKLREATQDY